MNIWTYDKKERVIRVANSGEGINVGLRLVNDLIIDALVSKHNAEVEERRNRTNNAATLLHQAQTDVATLQKTREEAYKTNEILRQGLEEAYRSIDALKLSLFDSENINRGVCYDISKSALELAQARVTIAELEETACRAATQLARAVFDGVITQDTYDAIMTGPT